MREFLQRARAQQKKNFFSIWSFAVPLHINGINCVRVSSRFHFSLDFIRLGRTAELCCFHEANSSSCLTIFHKVTQRLMENVHDENCCTIFRPGKEFKFTRKSFPMSSHSRILFYIYVASAASATEIRKQMANECVRDNQHVSALDYFTSDAARHKSQRNSFFCCCCNERTNKVSNCCSQFYALVYTASLGMAGEPARAQA